MQDTLKNTEVGFFDGADAASLGPKFTGFKNDPEGAIEHLLKEKTGDAVAVWSRPEIGQIDLIYGGAKGGLAHIQSKHPEGIAKLPALLKRGRVVKDEKSPRTVYLVDGNTPNHVTVIKLDWYGAEKSWVLTSYDDKDGRFAKRIALIDTESNTKKLDAAGVNCRPSTLRNLSIGHEFNEVNMLDDTTTTDVVAMMARLKLTGELSRIKKQIDALGADPMAMLSKLKLVGRSNEIRKELGASLVVATPEPVVSESPHISTLKAVAAGQRDSEGVAALFGVIQEAANALNEGGQLIDTAEQAANDAITHWAELEERLSVA